MERILVYYPFTIAEKADSGSKLRPKEMLRAFQTWGEQKGIEVLVISGNSDQRLKQFKQYKEQGLLENLLFCYAENQTIPLWLTDPGHIPKRPLADYQVFRFLKKKKVPIGIFYRDVYWKFEELYPLKGWKKKIMQSIYRLEEKFYEKYVDVIFLPSLEMGKYVEIHRPKHALPPGGKELIPEKEETRTDRVRAIYVGGLKHPDYGLPLMLDTLEKMKQLGMPIDLTIVCRKEEYAGIPENVKERIQALGIDVQHRSGKELEQLYKKMDFALIPRAKTRYNDFSVPVKLVDYLSHRLPIVATNCSAQAEIIESGPYGVICEANPDSMLKAMETMKANLSVYRNNIEKTFLLKHSWIARVEEVKRILLKEEQK